MPSGQIYTRRSAQRIRTLKLGAVVAAEWRRPYSILAPAIVIVIIRGDVGMKCSGVRVDAERAVLGLSLLGKLV